MDQTNCRAAHRDRLLQCTNNKITCQPRAETASDEDVLRELL